MRVNKVDYQMLNWARRKGYTLHLPRLIYTTALALAYCRPGIFLISPEIYVHQTRGRSEGVHWMILADNALSDARIARGSYNEARAQPNLIYGLFGVLAGSIFMSRPCVTTAGVLSDIILEESGEEIQRKAFRPSAAFRQSTTPRCVRVSNNTHTVRFE